MVLRPNGADPIQILRRTDPDCEQGWYLDEAAEQIKLCSMTCALVHSDPLARLELLFACTAPVFVPDE